MFLVYGYVYIYYYASVSLRQLFFLCRCDFNNLGCESNQHDDDEEMCFPINLVNNIEM